MGAALATSLLLACGDAHDDDKPPPDTVSACCYWSTNSGHQVFPPVFRAGCWSYEGPAEGVPQFFNDCERDFRPPYGGARTVIDGMCDESQATDGACSRHVMG